MSRAHRRPVFLPLNATFGLQFLVVLAEGRYIRQWRPSLRIGRGGPPSGKVIVNCVARFGICEGGQLGQVGTKNDVWAKYNLVGGSRS